MTRRVARGRDEGATAVEFGLTALFFFILVFAIVLFGIFMWQRQALHASAREGARYGIGIDSSGGTPQYADCAGIRQTAKDYSPDLGLTDADIDIEFYEDGAGSPFADCQSGGAPDPTAGDGSLASDVTHGDEVRVTARHEVTYIAFWPSLNGTIESTAIRRIFNGVHGP